MKSIRRLLGVEAESETGRALRDGRYEPRAGQQMDAGWPQEEGIVSIGETACP
jgi:hypothetical protein